MTKSKFTSQSLWIIVHRPRSTAHLIELQSLFSLVNGEKADNQNELLLYYGVNSLERRLYRPRSTVHSNYISIV
jgi:hypothetical protein